MMEAINHPFSALFEQLGLDASNQAIELFISRHKLPAELELAKAPFWTAAQATFLREEWHADSDWAEVIDQLNVSLR